MHVSWGAVKKRLSLRRLVSGSPAMPVIDKFVPTRMIIVDLDDNLRSITPERTASGHLYGAADILARQEGRPLGLLSVELREGALSASALRRQLILRWPNAFSDHKNTIP